MNIRTFFNSVKEGFQGILRHPLVTVASLTTILLILLLMSAFLLFSANARHIMRQVGQQPPIEVYMNLNSTEEQREAVSTYLTQNDAMVLAYEIRDPEENYHHFRDNLGDSASILDHFDYNTYLPYTFHIRLTDPAHADEVDMRLTAHPGVNKVLQESRVMHFLSQTTTWVNIGTAAAFIVLFLISLFIISNMVRISVYSRSTEISIMKFVGATSGYIRLPYVVEGAIVGMLSALLAWGVAHFAYSEVFDMMMADVDPSSFYAILPVNALSHWVLILCLTLGILIGAFGSAIAVRRYIKV